ncbi:MAG: methyltransferase domain-containing protein [candidate division WOR-3 bacterium]|nr:methyltransferase domain-containing protein [candidate division WOR-3 bacterium]MCX7757955.1 methyltransferase domain-containing protein [candidate division WOR-3 bacterium]MDW7987302.1 methyltransferase domain-containing protein [candidate division WOR-3 bacterium]
MCLWSWKRKLKHLEKIATSAEAKPLEILKNLNLKPGDLVADIGSGSGFFAIQFARLVGENGKVYALDTDERFLTFVKERAQKEGINNLFTIKVNAFELALPENVDLFFLRNVYHHLPEPIKYFVALRKFLKPHGRIAIIERTKPKRRLFSRQKHATPESVIVENLIRSGFVISNRFDFLTDQCFLIFRKEV